MPTNPETARIAVVHPKDGEAFVSPIGRIVVLRPAGDFGLGLALFSERDRPDFDADLARLVSILGLPVVHENLSMGEAPAAYWLGYADEAKAARR